MQLLLNPLSEVGLSDPQIMGDSNEDTADYEDFEFDFGGYDGTSEVEAGDKEVHTGPDIPNGMEQSLPNRTDERGVEKTTIWVGGYKYTQNGR
ncbi:unnamed protein product [Phytophthora fragariaefolia]|uniref:Unnamed protein product n=1 Tax=Phytophthora fragariaefolia TaxID=1490495 RepID=A0A9W6Y5C2_9STRA|nr:unnamed protein product [Phytophthora fragariaefolia]